MNPPLGKLLKRIRLFSSNVAVSLRRALLVDALFETSQLRKPHHRVKVGLIEGEYMGYYHLHNLQYLYQLGYKKDKKVVPVLNLLELQI